MVRGANHRFKYSTGLVVLTVDREVVLIKRRIPYCYENFLLTQKRVRLTDANIEKYAEEFAEKLMPKLPLHDQLDFVNYRTGLPMEDEIDFPHGQVNGSEGRRSVLERLDRQRRRVNCDGELLDALYATATREFEEETGYVLVDPPPRPRQAHWVSFIANDGREYDQFFFKISDVTLRRSARRPHRSSRQYVTVIADVREARRLLWRQQRAKRDGKHLLV